MPCIGEWRGMGSSRSRDGAAVLRGLALIACGAIGVSAWQLGMWGLFAGAVLSAIWLILLARAHAISAQQAASRFIDVDWRADLDPIAEGNAGQGAIVLRVLLDAAPTPLLAVDGRSVRALNRAARAMFATDDRVLPPPANLIAPDIAYLRHENRQWRIDRVEVASAARTVVALIDIEQEERTAEARATAELIHILGHELLNGLTPIVSLADSALTASAQPESHPLLSDILGTLARRAEGLQRFTEAYRALARLPEPDRRAVPIAELIEDLARLFRSRWPAVVLDVEIDISGAQAARIDRDQISQALWALLQNAAQAASTADRPPRVTLGTRLHAGLLMIDVGDSGAGVPAEDAQKIFRPFHTTKAEGTGIGLSLARQIVQAHGGSVILMPDRPTIFRVTLP